MIVIESPPVFSGEGDYSPPPLDLIRCVRDAILLHPPERWVRTITELGEVPALEWNGIVALLRDPLVPRVADGIVWHPEDRRIVADMRCCIGQLELWHSARQVLSVGWSASDALFVFGADPEFWSDEHLATGRSLLNLAVH